MLVTVDILTAQRKALIENERKITEIVQQEHKKNMIENIHFFQS